MKSVRSFVTSVLAILLTFAPALHAATFTVMTNADSGPGSLRQAIADAALAANPGADTIVFDGALSGGSITFASEIAVNDTAGIAVDASGLPAGLTLFGGGPGANRIFSNADGSSLTLAGLNLTGGGGTGATPSGSGGAIANTGTLVLTGCTLYGNSAAVRGSAIESRGANASVTLTNCTVVGNTAGMGAAIRITRGPLTLTHCTVVGNTGTDGSGGLSMQSTGTTTLINTIIADNSGNGAGSGSPDIGGAGTPLTLLGNNLIGSNDSSYAASFPAGLPNANGDYVGTAAFRLHPGLGSLGDYGGPVKTMPPLSGSLAVDNVTVANAVPGLTSDARGIARSLDGDGNGIASPDIGAYEVGSITAYSAWIYEKLPATATDAQHAASFDFDGDGVSNYDEFLVLTDPGVAASVLHITQSLISGGILSVTFPTVAGRHYTLEFTTDFAMWTNIPGSATAGTGSPITLSVTPVNGTPNYFVRVRVGP